MNATKGNEEGLCEKMKGRSGTYVFVLLLNSRFQVSLSSSRCPGSFLVSNGVANRPGCTFCNGVTDQVLQIPSDGQGSSLGVRATPPEYLSIPGHEDCLGSYR